MAERNDRRPPAMNQKWCYRDANGQFPAIPRSFTCSYPCIYSQLTAAQCDRTAYSQPPQLGRALLAVLPVDLDLGHEPIPRSIARRTRPADHGGTYTPDDG